MTTEQIHRVLEIITATHANKGFEIRFDNNFRANAVNHFVKFDDENELVHVFQHNRKAGEGDKQPFWLRSLPYEGIQEITSQHSQAEAHAVAIKAGFTEDEYKEIHHDIVITKEEFADSVHRNIFERDRSYEDL